MWLASFRLAEIVDYDRPLNALRHELRLHGLCEELSSIRSRSGRSPTTSHNERPRSPPTKRSCAHCTSAPTGYHRTWRTC